MMKMHAYLLMFWSVALPCLSAPVSISFLNDQESLARAVTELRSSDRTDASVTGFTNAVRGYYASPFALDLARFPNAKAGTYQFESSTNLVQALPHRLIDMNHAWDITCFEVVALLAGEEIRTRLTLDSLGGPFLAPCRRQNTGTFPLPVASPREALDATYGTTLGASFKAITGQEWTDGNGCLLVCLHTFTVLPVSRSPRQTTSDRTLAALRGQWQRNGLVFPASIQVVLLHNVDTTNRLVFTGHGGILINTGVGYTYIEKAGGFGPFVMLEVKGIEDLAVYYGSIVSSVNKGPFDATFLTVNDTTVMPVLPQPVPLMNDKNEIIGGSPNNTSEGIRRPADGSPKPSMCTFGNRRTDMDNPRVLALIMGIAAALALAGLRPIFDLNLQIYRKVGWPKGAERRLDKDSGWFVFSQAVLTLLVIASLVGLFVSRQ